MDMCKADRIRDDGVRHERDVIVWVWLDARFPASLKHFCYHAAFTSDVAFAKRIHVWDEARVLDHVLCILINCFPRQLEGCV